MKIINTSSIRKEIETFLSSIDGIEYSFTADSQTQMGNSIYYHVALNGKLYSEDQVKVRFSDHGISNRFRMAEEVTFYFINKEKWNENQLMYKLGVKGYEMQPTQFKEEVLEMDATQVKDDYEIIKSRTTKKGNIRHTIKRMVGTHFAVVKTI